MQPFAPLPRRIIIRTDNLKEYPRVTCMRKVVLTSVAFLLLASSALAQKQPKAGEILKASEAKAAEQNKSILLIFGASWCEACHQTDTFFALPDISPIIEQHFVVAHLTFGEAVAGHPDWDTPGSDTLILKYGGLTSSGRASIPFIAILDAKGRLLANSEITTKNSKESTGFPTEPAEVKAFLDMLQKGASSLTSDEIHKIEAGLHEAAAE